MTRAMERERAHPCMGCVSRLDFRHSAPSSFANNRGEMLKIGIALAVIWVLGFVLLRKVVGAVIHLLLIIAIVAVAWHFFGQRVG